MSSERPLRVAIVHTADQGGGAEASTYLLHQALRDLGHDSHMYVGAKRSDDPHVHELVRQRPFPGVLRAVKWIEGRTGWQYLYQPWFRKLDRQIGDVDVVHFHSLWYGRQGFADVAALPRLTRKYPSLMTLRDWWMFTGHCAHPAVDCERWKHGCGKCPDLNLAPAINVDGTRFNFRRKHRAIQQSNLRVTTVSRWLASEVQLSPIFAGKKIHAVHNGIDEQIFQPQDRKQARQSLGLPNDAFIVLIAGQSVEGTAGLKKGAGEYVIEALHASGVSPYLLAVGKSSQRILSLWGGSGTAIPFQSDPAELARYYCAADVVVAASLWETFGRVPAEAQMCGIPVAAFATGGIPEIVQHEQTGLIVERLNSAALGQAIRQLHDAPVHRNGMGQRAAEYAREHFSNRAIAQTYIQHYRDEIAHRTGRQGQYN
ncbi:MAG: glycosyltransferase [Planctomycetaceae bacterium]|nr:glycosyltransferase [Planctomycetaceae bacterium]